MNWLSRLLRTMYLLPQVIHLVPEVLPDHRNGETAQMDVARGRIERIHSDLTELDAKVRVAQADFRARGGVLRRPGK